MNPQDRAEAFIKRLAKAMPLGGSLGDISRERAHVVNRHAAQDRQRGRYKISVPPNAMKIQPHAEENVADIDYETARHRYERDDRPNLSSDERDDKIVRDRRGNMRRVPHDYGDAPRPPW